MEDDIACDYCEESFEQCVCVCQFCGERDNCTCVLFDSITGGG